MAEILVDLDTYEVVHVAEDGHTWGICESVEAYEAEVAKLGRTPQVVRRSGSFVTTRYAEKVEVTSWVPDLTSSVLEDLSPPTKFGVVKLPGVAASEINVKTFDIGAHGLTKRRLLMGSAIIRSLNGN